eukprot:6182890-Pleurochrysis_carterae.AAC.1
MRRDAFTSLGSCRCQVHSWKTQQSLVLSRVLMKSPRNQQSWCVARRPHAYTRAALACAAIAGSAESSASWSLENRARIRPIVVWWSSEIGEEMMRRSAASFRRSAARNDKNGHTVA